MKIKSSDYIKDLLELVKENPDLPVVPMVDSEVVADDYGYWMGRWGHCKKTKMYSGRERVHLYNDDDEEDVLSDLEGCKYYETIDGRDICDLSDDEWKSIYEGLPWVDCIVVYIVL